jgi:hypothetical protein
MRIQETNAIMKDAQIRRLDNERSEREANGVSLWRRLSRGRAVVPIIGGAIALVAATAASIFFYSRKSEKRF